MYVSVSQMCATHMEVYELICKMREIFLVHARVYYIKKNMIHFPAKHQQRKPTHNMCHTGTTRVADIATSVMMHV